MILDAQQLFLMFHKLIGGTPLCYMLHLKGDVDLQRLECSLNDVIASQPGLLLSFDPLPQTAVSLGVQRVSWAQRPWVSIQFVDKSDSFDEDQCLSLYHDLLNRKTVLTEWPLLKLKLVKTGAEKYVLFLSIEHTISNGLSSLQFLDLLLSHYAQSTPINHYSVDDYCSTVARINEHQPASSAMQASSALLKNIGKAAYVWNPEKKTRSSFVPLMRTLSYKLSIAHTQQAVKTAEKLRVSLYTLIICAYLNVFFRLPEAEDRIVFTLPTGGKVYPEVDASALIGCFAQALTLSFTKDYVLLSLEQRLRFIHQSLQEALRAEFDHIQSQKTAKSICKDFVITNGELDPFFKTLFRHSMKSNVYISYTGYSPLKCDYGSCKVEEYLEGTFNNAGVADFMHSIFDNQFHFFANYDEAFFSKQCIEQVLELLVSEFHNIIAVDSTVSELVPSSLGTIEPSIMGYLSQTFSSLFNTRLSEDSFSQDLEGKLGIDSLGRIRLITKIIRDYGSVVHQDDIFDCRSLLELGLALSKKLAGI